MNHAPGIDIGRGATLELPGMLVVTDEPFDGWTTRFIIVLAERRLIAHEVQVERSVDANAVDSAALRKVRVTELLREHLPQFIHDLDGKPIAPLPPGELAALKRSRARLLNFVADRYTIAQVLGLQPTKYVQDMTGGTPRATVSDWVRECRSLGYIDG